MRPSLRAIVWNDWPALASWIGVVVVWLLYPGYPHISKTTAVDPYFITLPAASTFVLLGILSWRIWRVFIYFSQGIELPGWISAISLIKDRGRLEYSYQDNDRVLASWSPVHKTKKVLGFQIGQSVTVLVSTEKPENSIIKELYL